MQVNKMRIGQTLKAAFVSVTSQKHSLDLLFDVSRRAPSTASLQRGFLAVFMELNAEIPPGCFVNTILLQIFPGGSLVEQESEISSPSGKAQSCR